MAQLGADVEQLDRLARTFQTEASRLERSASVLRGLVASVTWMGPDAGRFRGQYNQAMAPQLAAVARALTDEARNLGRQATQQRQASAHGVGGGAGLGGGVGGGGGGSFGVGGGFAFGAGGSTFTGVRAGDGEVFAGAEARGEYTASYGDLFSTRGWAEGQAGAGAEGSADLTMGDGQAAGAAEGYAFAGLRGEVGQHTSVFGGLVESESTLSGVLGAEAEGSGSFRLGLDGVSADAEARALAGAGARYTAETSLFGDFAGFGTEAYAEAGAWAEGEGRIDVGPGQFGAGGGFDVGAGARAGVEQDVSVFGDNVTATGGLGVRTGVSASASGDFDFGIDRIGGEVDLGGSLGLGFDASVGFSFSPSGLATGAADVASDVAEELPVVGGLFR
jgi:hypothetical protein